MTEVCTLLWPEICPFCGKASRVGTCPECREKLRKLEIQEPRCMQCGRPVRYAEQEYCRDCAETRHFYDQGYSLWLHRKPVNQSIYRFKYQNQRRFAAHYTAELTRAFEGQVRRWRPCLIMPVPLHKKRRRARGYNQAELIAEGLGRAFEIPVDAASLIRKKNTVPQKELDRQGRMQNMKNAFMLADSFLPVRTILLVDDIYTTGSTLDAAAFALKQRGVQKVYFLTISIGQG